MNIPLSCEVLSAPVYIQYMLAGLVVGFSCYPRKDGCALHHQYRTCSASGPSFGPSCIGYFGQAYGGTIEELEDAQLQLQTLLSMRHVTPFREIVQVRWRTQSATSSKYTTIGYLSSKPLLGCTLALFYTLDDAHECLKLEYQIVRLCLRVTRLPSWKKHNKSEIQATINHVR